CDDNKAVLNNTDKKQECSNECILSDIEKQFLNLILTNTSLNDFLKENRLMESVLVDQINEKLFDIIYDTAIDFAENKPIIIEDYITKIKEII
ncbi:MAG: tellurite resistance TerB C-terminal domain-containing protein, partial [Oscillospiraceae bacterium]